MVVLVILVYSCIVLLDMIPVVQKKAKGELALYVMVLLSSFVLSVLLSLGIDIPSPVKPIETVILKFLE